MAADLDASAAPPSHPFAGVYKFITGHLMIVNAVVTACCWVVASLDFLAPRLWFLPKVVYGAASAFVLLVLFAAMAPSAFAKARSLLGMSALADGAASRWRSPKAQFMALALAAASFIGFASVAKAGEGGLIASQSTAARGWQERLLGLERGVADISAGVDRANGKLDQLLAGVDDPRQALVARGYPTTSNGLLRAIKQGDAKAVALFATVGLRVDTEGPLAALMSGAQPWSPEVADALTPAMFTNPEACKSGHLMAWEIKAPTTARVEAFKRLCGTAGAIEAIREAEARDVDSQPANDAQAQSRSARKANLAMLMRG